MGLEADVVGVFGFGHGVGGVADGEGGLFYEVGAGLGGLGESF